MERQEDGLSGSLVKKEMEMRMTNRNVGSRRKRKKMGSVMRDGFCRRVSLWDGGVFGSRVFRNVRGRDVER